MDMTSTIIPKSDQTNYDDLISGPITITITSVSKGSAEQPVSIHYEGATGRPYKPSKSMRRVLVTIWGKDATDYVGRKLTLYGDPTVRFGADVVGGIKISHASHIDSAVTMALTKSRGKKEQFRVDPMAAESPKADLGALPEHWPQWTNEERGDYMATQGLDKLQAWWATVPPGAEKKALESRLRNDWKPNAK